MPGGTSSSADQQVLDGHHPAADCLDRHAVVVESRGQRAAPAVAPGDRPDGSWPVEIIDCLLSDERTGLQMLQTWVSSQRWVHRRVETITFLDERRVRRDVSVDLTVPEHAPSIEPRPGRAVRLLPLAIMRKRTLVNFDLRDREGHALMLPSLRQNQRLTFTLLQAWAQTLLGGQPPDRTLRKALERIACGTKEESEEAWGRLEKSTTSSSPEDDQLRALMSKPKFQAVLKRLRYCFLLFVAVEAEPLTRLLVRYSYERPITLYWKRAPGALRRVIGVQPTTLEFPQPSAEFSQSYHWEIETPKGVEIVRAELRGQKWAERRDFLGHGPAEAVLESSGEDVRLDTPELKLDLNLRRINLHTVDVPPGSRTRSVLDLRPERGGWLQLSTLIAWLSALAILIAALRLPHVMTARPGAERRPDAIVLLFVSYALILEALLIKPDEHRLATRLLKPFRRAAAVSGLLPLTVSFLLVFWPEAAWQRMVWLGLGAVGVLLAVTQTFALRIMASGESRYLWADDPGSTWTADALSRGRRIVGRRGDRRPPFRSVRRRVRRALFGSEASWSQAGRTNADEDFYGGDVWNQRVHQEVEEAVRTRLNRWV
jgi:hypothetical protein